MPHLVTYFLLKWVLCKMLQKESSIGRKHHSEESLSGSLCIKGWAGYIQRDGGTGLAMLPFCLFGQPVIADFMPTCGRALWKLGNFTMLFHIYSEFFCFVTTSCCGLAQPSLALSVSPCFSIVGPSMAVAHGRLVLQQGLGRQVGSMERPPFSFTMLSYAGCGGCTTYKHVITSLLSLFLPPLSLPLI